MPITVRRSSSRRDDIRSEFVCGAFARVVRLPRVAGPDRAAATYRAGTLEVRAAGPITRNREIVAITQRETGNNMTPAGHNDESVTAASAP